MAPSGYYQPIEDATLDFEGREVLYVVGTGCMEASCCGVGRWSYLRVEGYVTGREGLEGHEGSHGIEVDTIEDAGERAAISRLLLQRHPGARVEFR